MQFLTFLCFSWRSEFALLLLWPCLLVFFAKTRFENFKICWNLKDRGSPNLRPNAFFDVCGPRFLRSAILGVSEKKCSMLVYVEQHFLVTKVWSAILGVSEKQCSMLVYVEHYFSWSGSSRLGPAAPKSLFSFKIPFKNQLFSCSGSSRLGPAVPKSLLSFKNPFKSQLFSWPGPSRLGPAAPKSLFSFWFPFENQLFSCSGTSRLGPAASKSLLRLLNSFQKSIVFVVRLVPAAPKSLLSF